MEKTPGNLGSSAKYWENATGPPRRSLALDRAAASRSGQSAPVTRAQSASANSLNFSEATDVTSTPLLKSGRVRAGSSCYSPGFLVSPISHADSSSCGDIGAEQSFFSDGAGPTANYGQPGQPELGRTRSFSEKIPNVRCTADDVRQQEASTSSAADSGYLTRDTRSDFSTSIPTRRQWPYDCVDGDLPAGRLVSARGLVEPMRTRSMKRSTVEKAFQVQDASSIMSNYSCAPLHISIPITSINDAPSTREKMFAALDRNFAKYVGCIRPDRCSIGKFVGSRQLDIVAELDDYDTSGFVLSECFLPFLTPCALRMMRLVCRRWRDVVLKFSRGRWRRPMPGRDLPRRAPEDKENVPDRPDPCCALCDPDRAVSASAGASTSQASPPAASMSPLETPLGSPQGLFLRRGPLRCTQRLGASPLLHLGPLVKREVDAGRGETSSGGSTPRERFQSATASLLASEHLCRCPRCGGPCRVLAASCRARCMDEYCDFDYCTFCRYPPHADSPCQRCISPTREPARRSPERRLRKKLLKRL